jgi:hypothetical protein
LPAAQEPLGEPFRSFPSWLLRIECERRVIVRLAPLSVAFILCLSIATALRLVSAPSRFRSIMTK